MCILATDTANMMKEMGLTPARSDEEDDRGHGQGRSIPAKPAEYVDSFAIKRT